MVTDPQPTPPSTRVRRVRTTPETVALLEAIDRDLAAVQARAHATITGILASHGISGPARIVETSGTTKAPTLVIETPVRARPAG